MLSSSQRIVNIRRRGAPYLEGGTNFVGERFAPDTLTAFTSAVGITCLDHEAFDIPMPEGVIIVS